MRMLHIVFFHRRRENENGEKLFAIIRRVLFTTPSFDRNFLQRVCGEQFFLKRRGRKINFYYAGAVVVHHIQYTGRSNLK